MFITKIKLTDKEIFLQWEEFNEGSGENDAFAIHSKDTPHPDFDGAVNELRKWVLELCEITDHAASIEIKGLTLKAQENQFGASIAASKELQYSTTPLNLNTPFKWSEEVEGNEEQALPEGAVKAIEAVCGEACRFIKGKRQQMQLPLQEQKELETSDAEQ
jgi:hypothetical protein